MGVGSRAGGMGRWEGGQEEAGGSLMSLFT